MSSIEVAISEYLFAVISACLKNSQNLLKIGIAEKLLREWMKLLF